MKTNQYINKRVVTLLALLTVALNTSVSAQTNEKRIEKNRIRFEERQIRGPRHAIPPAILARAKGIVIVNRLKAGVGVGVEFGNGVALVRNAAGRWSPPAFVSLSKGSLGALVGGDHATSIVVLMTEPALNTLKKGGKLTAGATLKVVAGPVDIGGDIGTVNLKGPVLVYTDSKGLMKDASLSAGWVTGAGPRNHAHYKMGMQEILFTPRASLTPAGANLIKSITKYSGPQR